MESINRSTQLLQSHNYLTSIDLTDAFLHIPDSQNSQRFLRFRWEGQNFLFRTAPFGLSRSSLRCSPA